MSSDLFTSDGERKYLTTEELDRFLAAANAQERSEVRSFCLVLAHSGCRISEALALTPRSVDLREQTITFQTLKQREHTRYRSVPVPASTTDTLELVHGIRKAKRGRKSNVALWGWGRTQGFKHVKAVMAAADIEGQHASPKGLRHGFGVRAIQKTRNPRLVQKWLGHRSLETTTIYMDIIGQEERAEAQAMWT
ncbi:MAG: integrase/recombinase XerD [Planctomycetota bacterium]|jgi:integrase/recombinase XerD